MALPPFAKTSDFLQIYSGDMIAGANPVNLRDTFYPANTFTMSASFSLPGTTATITGQWNVDDGDLTIPAAIREPRIFAVKGKASARVTGPAIILRIEVNSSWGTCDVYIDGVKPSTIGGLSTFADVVDFNADNYAGLASAGYMDIVVADGLADVEHTVDLYANNGTNGFVVLSGIKARKFTLNPMNLQFWKSDAGSGVNKRFLTLHNKSTVSARNVVITPDPAMARVNGGSQPATVSVGDIAPDGKYTFGFSVDAFAKSSPDVLHLGLDATYADPAGSIGLAGEQTYAANSPSLTYSTTGWFLDNSGPGGSARAVSTAANKTVSFQANASVLRITIQKEYGWGTAAVMIGSTTYATLDCNDVTGGGFAATVTVLGLPSGNNTITIKSLNASTKPFVLLSVSFGFTAQYAQVHESIPIGISYADIPPLPAPNVRLQDGQVVCDPILKSAVDMSIPRTNFGVNRNRMYARFPTYCVYYNAGKTDILSSYDLVVVEPTAVSRQQVAHWQSKGIRVIGYVSFGEESPELSDIYDPQSPVKPKTDDGLGTGGYASYFNKGGNNFGESNECGNDRQRMEGVKACSVNNPKYFTGTGRCSQSCTKDNRTGYATQQAGGACGGGYTKLNFWQRTAMTACTNAGCPKYTPRHQNCTQFTPPDTHWGQDFAMDDTYPDQNGIWASTFINPLAPRWAEKLRTFYLPTVFNAAEQLVEHPSLTSHVIASDGSTKLVFRVSQYPIDDAEPLEIKSGTGFVYARNVDYSYDPTSGAFLLDPNAGVGAGQPAPVAGSLVTITYTKKGLQCDGVFMDTVDTVDVYPSDAFQNAFAGMINGLKARWPDKAFCSNRGFSILDRMIQSCSFVMFESFLVDYNFETMVYSKITDPGSVSYNNNIKAQLRDLRRQHRFDVLALNYCDNGPGGDALRQYIAEECLAEGYMSWSSTILLNDPLPNQSIPIARGPIRSMVWSLLKETKV